MQGEEGGGGEARGTRAFCWEKILCPLFIHNSLWQGNFIFRNLDWV